MKEQYVIEFAIEMMDGSIRHESFECRDLMDSARVIVGFRVKKGELVVYYNCQLVNTLF